VKRRSKAVVLGTLPLMAALVTGCGEEETAYCVNPQNEVVDNRYCGDDDDGGFGYFMFYDARPVGGGPVRKGVRVTGSPKNRIPASNKSAIASRGGFGSSAKSGIGRTVTRGGFSFSGGS
jgi:hypothetical protein